MLDSGAQTSFLSLAAYNRLPRKFRPPLKRHNVDIVMADGQSKLNVLGQVSMPVRVHDTRFDFSFTVTDMKGLDGIWGMDFLTQYKCDLKLSSGTYVFAGKEYPLISDQHSVLPHSVRLVQPLRLPPGREVATHAKLNRPFRIKQEVMLEPSVHFVQKYGVIPARSVTVQSRRRRSTPIQLFNPNE